MTKKTNEDEMKKKVLSQMMKKKDIGDELVKKMPPKVLKEVYKKISEKNFKDMLSNVFTLAMCAVKNCEKETLNLAKIQDEKDIKVSAIMKKFKEKKITQEKANAEILKINSQFQKTEENFKYMECSLKTCSEFMKKHLLFLINTLNKKFKDDKEKLNKLKEYTILFNKKIIDMKDVRQFFKEFI